MTTPPAAEPTGHAQLTAALAAFQADLPRVNKTKTATVHPKNGGRSYSYSYADLSDVSAAVLPKLAAQGLAWTCILEPNERGNLVLRGRLLHTSGESLECLFPLAADITPQALGGNLTYGRRYLLCSITGVAADEDNDASGVEPELEANRRQSRRQEARGELADQRGEQARRIAENTARVERERAEQARRAQDADAEAPQAPPASPRVSDPDAVLEVAHAIETASAGQLRAAWDTLMRAVSSGRITPADDTRLRADWVTRKDLVLKRNTTAPAADLAPAAVPVPA